MDKEGAAEQDEQIYKQCGAEVEVVGRKELGINEEQKHGRVYVYVLGGGLQAMVKQ